MVVLLWLALLSQGEEANLRDLRDVSPTIRKNAISTIAEKDFKGGIRPLIELLARETDDSVRNATVDALERLTGARGNTTSLVGTPRQVAEALCDYYDLGITTFLIRGFDPLDDAIEYGRSLLPLTRQMIAERKPMAAE